MTHCNPFAAFCGLCDATKPPSTAASAPRSRSTRIFSGITKAFVVVAFYSFWLRALRKDRLRSCSSVEFNSSVADTHLGLRQRNAPSLTLISVRSHCWPTVSGIFKLLVDPGHRASAFAPLGEVAPVEIVANIVETVVELQRSKRPESRKSQFPKVQYRYWFLAEITTSRVGHWLSRAIRILWDRTRPGYPTMPGRRLSVRADRQRLFHFT